MPQVSSRHTLDHYLFNCFKENGCIAAFSYSKKDMGFKDNSALKDNREDFLEYRKV